MHARLLFWSLRNRRWRHLLNAIATGVAVAIVIVFVAEVVTFFAFTKAYADNQLVRILVVPKLVQPGSATDGMPLTLKSQLDQMAGVKSVERKLVFMGKHDQDRPYAIAGEEDMGVEMNKDFYDVEPQALEAWKKDRPLGALVTEAAAQELNLQVGKHAEVPTTYGPMQINVDGIYKGTMFQYVIVIHFEYAQQVAKNLDNCGYRVFAPPAMLDHVIGDVEALTRNSSLPAEGVDSSRFRANAAKRMATVPIVLGFLGLFLVFTTGLTLANNSAISIRERRIEVATLRVMGFYPWSILRVLVGEAMIVGLFGGLAAVGVLYLLFHGSVTLTHSLPEAKIGIVPILAGMVVALVVPLFGALPSALAAVRVPLVTGLGQAA